MWPRVLPLAPLLAAVACARPAPPVVAAPSAEPELEPELAPGSPLVLDPGAEPRVTLRYRPEPGTRRALELRVDSAMTLGGTRTQLPTVVTTGSVEVRHVSGDGFGVRVVFDRNDVIEAPGVDRALADAIRKGVALFDGVAATAERDDRGDVLDLELPPGAAPHVIGVFEDYLAETTVAAMPGRPVGHGARWRLVDQRTRQGMVLETTNDCALLGVEGQRVTVRCATTIAVPPQPDDDDGEVAVEGDGEGAVDLVIDLATLEMSLSSRVQLRLRLDTGAGPSPVELSWRLQLRHH